MTDRAPLTNEEIAAAKAEAERRGLEIVTDVARRVHTVLCNFAEVRSRQNRGQPVPHHESLSIINGAVSGIAVLVARMAIQRVPGATDERSVEEYFADVLKEQFVLTYRETQAADAKFDIAKGAPVN